MPQSFSFEEVARLPMSGDNVAIATRKLPAGTRIGYEDNILSLDFTVLEGHRFAVAPIAAGEKLLSWELPFGVALTDIGPGNYIANKEMLKALRGRSIDFALPDEANFADHVEPYRLDESQFEAGEQVTAHPQPSDSQPTFSGYRRPGGRGVGTRNMIVLLGTSSRTGGFVKQLEARLAGVAEQHENIDSVVAVAHTEGGHEDPNNREFVLRTLAGFMVHANVGAVLAVDYGVEPVTNVDLHNYARDSGYPLDDVLHDFFTISGGFQRALDDAESIVRGWVEPLNEMERSQESLAHLKIALQCGGSDAFSGVSGNPLASWVAKEIIRYGGAANLAETDELIGAEPYVLQNVRDVETAQRFLETIRRFEERVSWHGTSAAGNPSGGNKFRGLYNIVLKSIGAARKRHPDVRLDRVIEYGEPMDAPGFYFMDSPGNDLESIAGQVASGCNLIFFVTGNGSITNFPFVPTIKIVTTTRRYELLAREMDVNAGRYLDGETMDTVGADTLALTVDVASGQRTVGEKAGHAQVQLWRDWRQSDDSNLEKLRREPQADGKPLPLVETKWQETFLPADLQLFDGTVSDRVGLILPTSLCAGQIARMAAARLTKEGMGAEKGISRFVALAHTEGCGASSDAEALYIRTLLGYLRHPLAAHVLLMEHGCEKTHNDYLRHEIERLGLDPAQFGWASIQMDGGIESVLTRTEEWFARTIAQDGRHSRRQAGPEQMRVGLLCAGPVSNVAAAALGRFSAGIVSGGGTAVIAENAALLSSPDYRLATVGDETVLPSLAYGQSLQDAAEARGLHVMETPAADWTETVTGLAATGVEIIVAYVGEHSVTGHPLVPVVQVTAEERVEQHYGDDMDVILGGNPDGWPQSVVDLIADVLSGRKAARLREQGNVDFQFTRGLLGVSL